MALTFVTSCFACKSSRSIVTVYGIGGKVKIQPQRELVQKVYGRVVIHMDHLHSCRGWQRTSRSRALPLRSPVRLPRTRSPRDKQLLILDAPAQTRHESRHKSGQSNVVWTKGPPNQRQKRQQQHHPRCSAGNEKWQNSQKWSSFRQHSLGRLEMPAHTITTTQETRIRSQA